jgi:hypothetical protein
MARVRGGVAEEHGTPHPRCFAKRGCKRLKIKERRWKKRGKRLPFEAQGKQEAASY